MEVSVGIVTSSEPEDHRRARLAARNVRTQIVLRRVRRELSPCERQAAVARNAAPDFVPVIRPQGHVGDIGEVEGIRGVARYIDGIRIIRVYADSTGVIGLRRV